MSHSTGVTYAITQCSTEGCAEPGSGTNTVRESMSYDLGATPEAGVRH